MSILDLLIALGLAGRLISTGVRSDYLTEVGVPRQQPIPFSHEHHVGGDDIDCRDCYASVEESSFAGIPATETRMSCHSRTWADSPMLQPVRESYRDGNPLPVDQGLEAAGRAARAQPPRRS